MNFANVKSITIPEGKVKKITAGGVVIWEAVSYTNLVPTAKYTDGTVLDGIGYRRGVSWNGNKLVTTNTAFTAIGFISFGDGTKAYDIYVYGLDFSGSTYNKFQVCDSSYNPLSAGNGIKDGFSNTVVTVTKLADNYFKLSTPGYSSKVKTFIISGVTVDGITPIVTIDEPII